MNKRLWFITGGVVAWLLVGLLVLAGGGIVYAAQHGRLPNLVRQTGQAVWSKAAPQVEMESGIVIAALSADGPAAQAGLARGDILLEIDGKKLDQPLDLQRYLQQHKPGEQVQLIVRHGDDQQALTVTLGERNGQPYLGLSPCGGPLESRLEIRVESAGALIRAVTPDSPADQAGLKEGDVIEAVDGKSITPDNDLADLIAAHKPGDTLTLSVKSGDEAEAREVEVKLSEHPDKAGTAYLGVQYVPSLPKGVMMGGRAMPFHLSPDDALPFEGMPPFGSFPIMSGVIVGDVLADGPADRAGIQAGDVITTLEGKALDAPDSLIEALTDYKPGDKVTLTVYRRGEQADDEGQAIELEITLAENPDKPGAAYLGVTVGGAFMRHMEGEGSPMEDFEGFFETLPKPLENLPEGLDGGQQRFEFHWSPDDVGGDQPACCSDV